MYARNGFVGAVQRPAFTRHGVQNQEASSPFVPTSVVSNEADSYANGGYFQRESGTFSGNANPSYIPPSSYNPTPHTSNQMYRKPDGASGLDPFFVHGRMFCNSQISNHESSGRRSLDIVEFGGSSSLPLEMPLYNTHRLSLSNAHNSRPSRRPSNRDEFDGVNQYLPPLNPAYIAAQERDIPHLPTNLVAQEQDEVLSMVTHRLSRCAYDFVAKYEFPIPVDNKLRPVTRPEDREWTEWVYLLKRLATKRRIPARLLYQGQIKQLVTILENSLEMRCVVRVGSRPLRDDRNVLQLISAGIQVAKILKDAPAVEDLDALYIETDTKIAVRMGRSGRIFR